MTTIHYVLDIDAGTDSVWSALTEADRMAQWSGTGKPSGCTDTKEDT